MTLQEIMQSEQAFLLPKDIAPVMGSNPQDIRVAARLGVLGVAPHHRGHLNRGPG